METLMIGGYPFEPVGAVRLETDRAGKFLEDRYTLPPLVRPNRYAAGPFCRFELPGAPRVAGVYGITAAREPMYVGECEDLASRFGPGGYGRIYARACHHDGQATNCKVNALILNSVKSGKGIEVWLHRGDQRKLVERAILADLTPPWNGRGAGAVDAGATAVPVVPAVPLPEKMAGRATDNASRVVEWLRERQLQHFCNKCISERTGVTPVAQVNQIVRPLAQASREWRYEQAMCAGCDKVRMCIVYIGL